jgi:hypothetical protein
VLQGWSNPIKRDQSVSVADQFEDESGADWETLPNQFDRLHFSVHRSGWRNQYDLISPEL